MLHHSLGYFFRFLYIVAPKNKFENKFLIAKIFSTRKLDGRAATDPADPDPDPDLLTTRIQNLRSGSVKELCATKFCTKF